MGIEVYLFLCKLPGVHIPLRLEEVALNFISLKFTFNFLADVLASAACRVVNDCNWLGGQPGPANLDRLRLGTRIVLDIARYRGRLSRVARAIITRRLDIVLEVRPDQIFELLTRPISTADRHEW